MAIDGTVNGISILIVEDEVLVALAAKEVLESMGHTVVAVVSDGRDALLQAGVFMPELVLMDIGLRGEMDGIEAASALYEQLGIPVVYLTGAGDAATINRAARSRPFGYLLKPFSEAELRGAIEVAVARRHAEAELQHRERTLLQYAKSLRTQSLVDELTGLYNRRGFLTLSRHLLKALQRHRRPSVLLFIDLNGLKQVNDTQGHAAGDRMLKDLAGILSRTFRRSDVVARLGGDEFVVLAMESESAGGDSAIHRLREGVREHNGTHDAARQLAISVGVAIPDPLFPEPLETLLARADAEMYKEKKGIIAS